jgi:hypothetical protein
VSVAPLDAFALLMAVIGSEAHWKNRANVLGSSREADGRTRLPQRHIKRVNIAVQ